MWQSAVTAAGLALLLSSLVIYLMLKSGLAARILDKPNQRSLHVVAIPRSGGLCFMPIVVAVALALNHGAEWPLLLLAALLILVFALDDIRSLSVIVRFGVQILASACVVYLSGNLSWALALFALITVVWSMNVFNFMDGSNGLAAGMAVFGFGTYALAALDQGALSLAVIAASVVGAALGFLIFNFDPAKIFMGDAGSVPLGFLASGIGLLGWSRGAWPGWFPMLVFSPFLMDATVMILRRLFRGERIHVAHCDHYYQRMVRTGFGHRGVALRAYVLMALASCCAIFLVDRCVFVLAAAIGWVLLYGGIFLYIDLKIAPLARPYSEAKTSDKVID
jgi:UDP-N-acetylmuramyl pentapeptide phosphotransferase/UDP-N-acetylglucosamine-1-phosphate transferase